MGQHACCACVYVRRTGEVDEEGGHALVRVEVLDVVLAGRVAQHLQQAYTRVTRPLQACLAGIKRWWWWWWRRADVVAGRLCTDVRTATLVVHQHT